MYRLHCTARTGTAFVVIPSSSSDGRFHEWGRYVLHLEQAADFTLVIDDVALSGERSGDRQSWEWQPGFFAGTVRAELFDHQGVCLANYRLEVVPDAGKLGQGLFDQMIGELFRDDPRLLFGEEAAQSAIGGEGDYGDPYLEYARLKSFGTKFLSSLRQLCHEPVAGLRRGRKLVAPHHVRRVDAHGARALLRSPQTLAAVLRPGSSVPTDLLFNVPFSREEFDTPAHRTLLSQILAVARRVRKVRANLEVLGARKESIGFRTPMTPRLSHRFRLLDDLDAGLRCLCKSMPFSAVTRAEVCAAGLNVIAGHPLYATAYRHAWQALRPGIEGPREGEMLSLSPTWEVYERWCFLQLANVLREIFPSLAWVRHSTGGKADRLLEVGSCDGIRVEIYLQRIFHAMDNIPKDSRFHSISGERRPDIVVTYASKGLKRCLVFDAKYSVSRDSVLAAMGAAHIYRDCLRWDGQRPQGVLLLIPSPGKAAWLETADYFDQNAVGVLSLSPSSGQRRLRALMENQFFSAEAGAALSSGHHDEVAVRDAQVPE
jgi:hypothetical protein